MNIGAELGQLYFANKQFKKILKIQWGLNPLTFLLGTPVLPSVSW